MMVVAVVTILRVVLILTTLPILRGVAARGGHPGGW